MPFVCSYFFLWGSQVFFNLAMRIGKESQGVRLRGVYGICGLILGVVDLIRSVHQENKMR